MNAATIQIFLPHGEPRGIKIAEITTRIVQAVSFPRTRLEDLLKREEIDSIGVYFLFGEGKGVKPLAYIGQTEDLRGRLKTHNVNKDFWHTGIFVISRTRSFTQAHIRYLEWTAIQKAMEAGRYELENNTQKNKPHVTEAIEADLKEAFETTKILMGTLGFPLFEPLASMDRRRKDVFYCRRKSGGDARGQLVEDGFVVFKGSLARKRIQPSAESYLTRWREPLLEKGVLEDRGDAYVFTQDYLFPSPSNAASIVLGSGGTQWKDWVTEDGRTLHDVLSADSEGNSK